ncbi:DUF3304 domain-containing protein [Pseudomonas chlororaphis]|uniref:DUF3304 domain-containing protein n=1 Tax=Pseudomonas chlororaphis TaxID=587753 RepID=UPI000F6BDA32|nr:DUF3304 domain-containing protein [Pseudomonas chlororaphis]AZE08163.1 hypothetical protein C4K11_6046 [Pseudomonas chlororaphis subsp. aureofaciens]AZE14345.1 hypothetical protein C4K10_6110 [Pseudomonas chlororaphis subsp. aureofaciens]
MCTLIINKIMAYFFLLRKNGFLSGAYVHIQGRFYIFDLVRCSSLVLGVVTVSACQAESKMLSAPVTGYNHTSAAINQFTINGAGGPNLGPNLGGGGEVCCSVIPRKWNPGLKAIVKWEKDPNAGASVNWPPLGTDAYREAYRKHAAKFTRHQVVVDIPQYGEKVCALQVHFLPCDQVKVSTTCFTPSNPNYPDKEYFKIKEPAVCPSH